MDTRSSLKRTILCELLKSIWLVSQRVQLVIDFEAIYSQSLTRHEAVELGGQYTAVFKIPTPALSYLLVPASGFGAEGTAERRLHQNSYDEDGLPVDDKTKEHIKCIAATLYGAGSDTTVSGVQSFFLAMTLYPDVQARAQEEIDAYMRNPSRADGPHTMISPADRPNLPYTSALVRELLRWHPIVPLVGHRVGQNGDNLVDLEGDTYQLPAGCLILILRPFGVLQGRVLDGWMRRPGMASATWIKRWLYTKGNTDMNANNGKDYCRPTGIGWGTRSEATG
ncbi:cytochrome P450 family protein [Ceratobasidium sp. AG-Ba]|nr:cytochrome P450 family protein [Ceratobasidium sp. AG-Ba]